MCCQMMILLNTCINMYNLTKYHLTVILFMITDKYLYSHKTAHIEYGLYENIEATAAFNLHMQNEK